MSTLNHEAQWRVDSDEETGKHFWRGAAVGDMDETKFNPGNHLTMDAASFRVGTVVNVSEPAARCQCDCGMTWVAAKWKCHICGVSSV